MEIQQLLSFTKAVEKPSFAQAADALFILRTPFPHTYGIVVLSGAKGAGNR